MVSTISLSKIFKLNNNVVVGLVEVVAVVGLVVVVVVAAAAGRLQRTDS